jgi:hypothetical protein
MVENLSRKEDAGPGALNWQSAEDRLAQSYLSYFPVRRGRPLQAGTISSGSDPSPRSVLL